MAERPHNFLREGVITGFIGATAIAVWFLVVDTIAARPFYTPIFLGKGVVSVLGKNMMGDTAFTQVSDTRSSTTRRSSSWESC